MNNSPATVTTGGIIAGDLRDIYC